MPTANCDQPTFVAVSTCRRLTFFGAALSAAFATVSGSPCLVAGAGSFGSASGCSVGVGSGGVSSLAGVGGLLEPPPEAVGLGLAAGVGDGAGVGVGVGAGVGAGAAGGVPPTGRAYIATTTVCGPLPW